MGPTQMSINWWQDKRKMWYTCKLDHYSAIEWKKILFFTPKWMQVVTVMLSEINQYLEDKFLLLRVKGRQDSWPAPLPLHKRTFIPIGQWVNKDLFQWELPAAARRRGIPTERDSRIWSCGVFMHTSRNNRKVEIKPIFDQSNNLT